MPSGRRAACVWRPWWAVPDPLCGCHPTAGAAHRYGPVNRSPSAPREVGEPPAPKVLLAVVLDVAALAQSREVRGGVVRRIVVAMGRRQHHACRPPRRPVALRRGAVAKHPPLTGPPDLALGITPGVRAAGRSSRIACWLGETGSTPTARASRSGKASGGVDGSATTYVAPRAAHYIGRQSCTVGETKDSVNQFRRTLSV